MHTFWLNIAMGVSCHSCQAAHSISKEWMGRENKPSIVAGGGDYLDRKERRRGKLGDEGCKESSGDDTDAHFFTEPLPTTILCWRPLQLTGAFSLANRYGYVQAIVGRRSTQNSPLNMWPLKCCGGSWLQILLLSAGRFWSWRFCAECEGPILKKHFPAGLWGKLRPCNRHVTRDDFQVARQKPEGLVTFWSYSVIMLVPGEVPGDGECEKHGRGNTSSCQSMAMTLILVLKRYSFCWPEGWCICGEGMQSDMRLSTLQDDNSWKSCSSRTCHDLWQRDDNYYMLILSANRRDDKLIVSGKSMKKVWARWPTSAVLLSARFPAEKALTRRDTEPVRKLVHRETWNPYIVLWIKHVPVFVCESTHL